jgi:hypothetical protein
MKRFLKLASIPLAAVIIVLGIPLVVASAINAHSTLALVGLLIGGCAVFAAVVGYAINTFNSMKIKEENEV